ncbi:hypothetical protein GGR52DRAFT_440555 [Hypoxylon sp. FL1284]|nr:hypothetical protein GGR52DRAFT_440555 [Hypoxylon sp. FL1284]
MGLGWTSDGQTSCCARLAINNGLSPSRENETTDTCLELVKIDTLFLALLGARPNLHLSRGGLGVYNIYELGRIIVCKVRNFYLVLPRPNKIKMQCCHAMYTFNSRVCMLMYALVYSLHTTPNVEHPHQAYIARRPTLWGEWREEEQIDRQGRDLSAYLHGRQEEERRNEYIRVCRYKKRHRSEREIEVTHTKASHCIASHRWLRHSRGAYR